MPNLRCGFNYCSLTDEQLKLLLEFCNGCLDLINKARFISQLLQPSIPAVLTPIEPILKGTEKKIIKLRKVVRNIKTDDDVTKYGLTSAGAASGAAMGAAVGALVS